jgi:hypothetical protein
MGSSFGGGGADCREGGIHLGQKAQPPEACQESSPTVRNALQEQQPSQGQRRQQDPGHKSAEGGAVADSAGVEGNSHVATKAKGPTDGKLEPVATSLCRPTQGHVLLNSPITAPQSDAAAKTISFTFGDNSSALAPAGTSSESAAVDTAEQGAHDVSSAEKPAGSFSSGIHGGVDPESSSAGCESGVITAVEGACARAAEENDQRQVASQLLRLHLEEVDAHAQPKKETFPHSEGQGSRRGDALPEQLSQPSPPPVTKESMPPRLHLADKRPQDPVSDFACLSEPLQQQQPRPREIARSASISAALLPGYASESSEADPDVCPAVQPGMSAGQFTQIGPSVPSTTSAATPEKSEFEHTTSRADCVSVKLSPELSAGQQPLLPPSLADAQASLCPAQQTRIPGLEQRVFSRAIMPSGCLPVPSAKTNTITGTGRPSGLSDPPLPPHIVGAPAWQPPLHGAAPRPEPGQAIMPPPPPPLISHMPAPRPAPIGVPPPPLRWSQQPGQHLLPPHVAPVSQPPWRPQYHGLNEPMRQPYYNDQLFMNHQSHPGLPAQLADQACYHQGIGCAAAQERSFLQQSPVTAQLGATPQRAGATDQGAHRRRIFGRAGSRAPRTHTQTFRCPGSLQIRDRVRKQAAESAAGRDGWKRFAVKSELP